MLPIKILPRKPSTGLLNKKNPILLAWLCNKIFLCSKLWRFSLSGTWTAHLVMLSVQSELHPSMPWTLMDTSCIMSCGNSSPGHLDGPWQSGERGCMDEKVTLHPFLALTWTQRKHPKTPSTALQLRSCCFLSWWLMFVAGQVTKLARVSISSTLHEPEITQL